MTDLRFNINAVLKASFPSIEKSRAMALDCIMNLIWQADVAARGCTCPPSLSVDPTPLEGPCEFCSTHKFELYSHADGGTYAFVEHGAQKCAATGEWQDAVFYRGQDGLLRSTTKARWAERFTRIAP